MKKKPIHQAYIAIEDTMMAAVRAAIMPRTEKLIADVRHALSVKDFSAAHHAVNTFTLAPAMDAARPKLKELAVSALLFGASRHGPVEDTHHMKRGTIPYVVDQSINHLCVMVVHNATLRARAAALLLIRSAIACPTLPPSRRGHEMGIAHGACGGISRFRGPIPMGLSDEIGRAHV